MKDTLLTFVMLMMLVTAAQAQPPTAHPVEPADPTHTTSTDQPSVHGWFSDVHSTREQVEEAGITAELLIIVDYVKPLRGGLDTQGESLLHLLEVGLHFDLDKLLNLEGATAFVGFQNQSGDTPTEHEVGDFQGLSNIEADGRTQLAQIWLEQRFIDEKLRIKIGKVDANSEFAFVEHGGEFLNSSAGFSPTVLGMPTYPDPSFGLLGFVYPTDNLYLGAAFFDGAGHEDYRTGSRGPSTWLGSPSDSMFLLESGLQWPDHALPGRVAIGAWHHTGHFDQFTGGEDKGISGFYIVADQAMWQNTDASSHIGGFFQYGYAPADVSEVDHHVGIGMTLTGTLPSRDDDALGVMASYVHFSDDADFSEDYELVFEAFYKLQLARFVSVKPDLQYIINPGGGGLRDALVLTLRTEFEF